MSFSAAWVEVDMQHVLSGDGTSIAFESMGAGPPVIFVVGAFNDHSTGAELALALAERHTLITYDRRGRGQSGDTLPYAVEREIEDLAAVLATVGDRGRGLRGGGAAVFGFSSGAILALRAAAAGLPIGRVAVYDAPYAAPRPGEAASVPAVESRVGAGAGPGHADRLAALLAEGRRGDAVEYFQADMVGIPRETVVQLRHAPFRPALEAMAETLVYDALLVGDGSLPGAALAARITQPTLVLAGGASRAMAEAAQALAARLPHAECEIVPDQGHDLVAATLAPRLTAFLTR